MTNMQKIMKISEVGAVMGQYIEVVKFMNDLEHSTSELKPEFEKALDIVYRVITTVAAKGDEEL